MNEESRQRDLSLEFAYVNGTGWRQRESCDVEKTRNRWTFSADVPSRSGLHSAPGMW